MLRFRYASALGAGLLFCCSTDTFTTDGGPDDSSADATHSDAAQPDSGVGDAGGADTAPGGSCEFDGAVLRPTSCTTSCTQNGSSCCIAVDAGNVSCQSFCAADSFSCFSPTDCVSAHCCVTAVLNVFACPRLIDEKYPSSSVCAASCGPGSARACLTDSDCPTTLEHCNTVTLPGFEFRVGVCL